MYCIYTHGSHYDLEGSTNDAYGRLEPTIILHEHNYTKELKKLY